MPLAIRLKLIVLTLNYRTNVSGRTARTIVNRSLDNKSMPCAPASPTSRDSCEHITLTQFKSLEECWSEYRTIFP